MIKKLKVLKKNNVTIKLTQVKRSTMLKSDPI